MYFLCPLRPLGLEVWPFIETDAKNPCTDTQSNLHRCATGVEQFASDIGGKDNTQWFGQIHISIDPARRLVRHRSGIATGARPSHQLCLQNRVLPSVQDSLAWRHELADRTNSRIQQEAQQTSHGQGDERLGGATRRHV